MLEPADDTSPLTRPWTPSVEDEDGADGPPLALGEPSPTSFTLVMTALPQRVDTVEDSLAQLSERVNGLQASVAQATAAPRLAADAAAVAAAAAGGDGAGEQVEAAVLALQQRAGELSDALRSVEEKETEAVKREQDAEELRAKAEALSAQLEQQVSLQTERLASVEKTLAAQAEDLGAVAAGVQAAVATPPDSPELAGAVAALQAQTAQISLDLAHATMQKTGEMVLINDALAEIDQLIKISEHGKPDDERALGDRLRAELQEELEHVEVTLREEFVSVQLQVDGLGREVARLQDRSPRSTSTNA